MVRKRIRLAQNFFRDRKLVAALVAGSSVGPGDVVYEIGAGRGIVTRELARRAGRVVAVEKDPALVARLRATFRDSANVRIVSGDFLKYRVRDSRYRVFANLPFNITARVVKRLLFGSDPPTEAHLVMQREAAARFAGLPVETEVSVLAKPWFRLAPVYRFRRADFDPAPGVEVVLLHIARRRPPLVRRRDAGLYRRFVRQGFEAWKPDLRTAYRRVFTSAQWKRLARDLGFPVRVTATGLTFEQWLGMFDLLRRKAHRPHPAAAGTEDGRRKSEVGRHGWEEPPGGPLPSGVCGLLTPGPGSGCILSRKPHRRSHALSRMRRPGRTG